MPEDTRTLGDKAIAFIIKLGTVVGSVVAVTTLAYGIVIKAGWVIGRAEAQTMVTLAVQQAAADNSKALLDEVKARQIADLKFQLELVNEDIQELLQAGDLSAAEEDQLEQLKKARDQINSQIAGMGQ